MKLRRPAGAAPAWRLSRSSPRRLPPVARPRAAIRRPAPARARRRPGFRRNSTRRDRRRCPPHPGPVPPPGVSGRRLGRADRPRLVRGPRTARDGLRLLRRRAAAAGWRPIGRNGLGFTHAWAKSYPDGAAARLAPAGESGRARVEKSLSTRRLHDNRRDVSPLQRHRPPRDQSGVAARPREWAEGTMGAESRPLASG